MVTSSSDERLKRAKVLGAAARINHRRMPEWSTSVLEMTDGHGSITSLMWADQRSSRSR
ncbi:hypothetical protein [Rhizobium sp. BK512]|uniref:hypothetical protein n=1 Tax=Rhizobium sp. BK512 TaxID=2587010 RepID=UPI00391B2867